MLPFAPWHSLEQGNHLTMPMRWGWHLEVSMVQNISESSGHRGRWTMKTAGTLGHHPALAQEHVPQWESVCFACRRPWDQSPASPCFFASPDPSLLVMGLAELSTDPCQKHWCCLGAWQAQECGGQQLYTVGATPHASPSSCPTHPAQPQAVVTGGEQREDPRGLCTSREKQDRL